MRGGRVSEVVTRFPPEPNGYLHICHPKAIALNFGIAEEFGGRCHLRFDDTNPIKEEQEYIDSIQQDVRWLGFDWGEHLYYASDNFQHCDEVGHELRSRDADRREASDPLVRIDELQNPLPEKDPSRHAPDQNR